MCMVTSGCHWGTTAEADPLKHAILISRHMLELKFTICHKAAKSVLTGFLTRGLRYWVKSYCMTQASVQAPTQ